MAFNQNVELVGLNSVDTAVPTAGAYVVSGKIDIPTVVGGGGQSSVVATISNRTGPVTLFTSVAGADGFTVEALCAAGDFLRVALTSAATADQPLNAIKCQIQISSGV